MSCSRLLGIVPALCNFLEGLGAYFESVKEEELVGYVDMFDEANVYEQGPDAVFINCLHVMLDIFECVFSSYPRWSSESNNLLMVGLYIACSHPPPFLAYAAENLMKHVLVAGCV